MDDNEIIKLYLDRDEAAIPQTAAKYGAYCYTVANNILSSHEDSEECVNDTWFSAWNAIPPTRPGRLRLFLARITRNLSFNRFQAARAAKRGGEETALALEELAECVADTRTVETELELRELSLCISRFLHSLSERDSNIFLLRYFYVMPVHRIAARCGLSEKHTSTVLSRTRKKLAEYLKQEGYLYS
ncbi:MAG: sigma-70 family RNA polymerase sigma factor [Lachnospiraceae bacterium]|nr:sigma-70 family RNA polymerase sigma factor [Lachnospiraceae bacterium]